MQTAVEGQAVSVWVEVVKEEEEEEEGVVVVSRRCFDAKVCTDEDVFKGPEIDCYDCGDGPAGSISTVAHEDDYTCRSCGNCMPFCSRCMRTNGLEIITLRVVSRSGLEHKL